ncbi:MAG: hypothetical protein WD067_10520 [Gaiellaceae bacterium]
MRDLAARARASYETELGTVGAFLPERTPPDRLAPPFTRYGDACLELPRRHPAEFGGVRRWLDDEFGAVDPPAVSALVDLPRSQQDELMTVLSFLAHAYRWDTIPPAPERFAERQIALPAGIEEPVDRARAPARLDLRAPRAGGHGRRRAAAPGARDAAFWEHVLDWKLVRRNEAGFTDAFARSESGAARVDVILDEARGGLLAIARRES